MSEHLLHFTDRDTAIAERPDLFVEYEGEHYLRSSAGIETRAVTSDGTEPVYAEDGETVIEPGTPPTFAEGYWVLLETAIAAEPIVLPQGVLRLTLTYTDPMPAPVTA